MDEALEHLAALKCTEDLYYSDEDNEDESADDKDEDTEGAIGPAPSTNNTPQLNIVLTKNSPLLTE